MPIDFDIDEQNSLNKGHLCSILCEGNAVLMAGAGCSAMAGYPTWEQLIEEMQKELAPKLTLPSTDIMINAQVIKNECITCHRDSVPFDRFLRRKFSAKNPAYSDFHCTLVKLGFAGYTTTNYDPVLEGAIRNAFSDKHTECESINLCIEEERDLVLSFLREIGNKNHFHPQVLHLHGFYTRPSNLILTCDDYQKFYGIPSTNGSSQEQNKNADTIHRRAIWALLATRTMVFVGFSLKDSFFLSVLEVWRNDFNIRLEKPHIAIMPYNSIEEIPMIDKKLQMLGIMPIYYKVANKGTSQDNPLFIHGELDKLITEIAEKRGIPTSQPSLDELNRRTLDLIQ